MSKIELYTAKDENYFSNIRWNIIDLIPEGNHRVLDVGCGDGATLKKLKELGKASEIYGIEIYEDITEKLSQDLDKIIIGDIESIDLQFNYKYFDYIIFGDILEHLINPNKILHQYKKLLKDDGYIIASIPNIKYFRILLRLIIFDEFKYSDDGILDQSHLRFFTKKEIKKMFHNENFEIIHIKSNFCWAIKIIDGRFFNIISKLLPFRSFFTIQYMIKARKDLLSAQKSS